MSRFSCAMLSTASPVRLQSGSREGIGINRVVWFGKPGGACRSGMQSRQPALWNEAGAPCVPLTLSTCSNVDQIHCGALGVLVMT